MRKLIIISILLLTGGVIALNTGCEKDPEEACQQDKFCDGSVSVTACCTDGEDCYYTYNGKKYPDTDEGLNQLIEDLDCTTAKKSTSVEDVLAYMKSRLKMLIEDARIASEQ